MIFFLFFGGFFWKHFWSHQFQISLIWLNKQSWYIYRQNLMLWISPVCCHHNFILVGLWECLFFEKDYSSVISLKMVAFLQQFHSSHSDDVSPTSITPFILSVVTHPLVSWWFIPVPCCSRLWQGGGGTSRCFLGERSNFGTQMVTQQRESERGQWKTQSTIVWHIWEN